jgi:hypothetical protein
MRRLGHNRFDRLPALPRPPPSGQEASSPASGSVTFWLAATPTPARAWAQRAATAGDEEEITIPNRAGFRATGKQRKRHATPLQPWQPGGASPPEPPEDIFPEKKNGAFPFFSGKISHGGPGV